MVNSLIVKSTIKNQTPWEDAAKALFDIGPVAIMERTEDNFTIFAKVIGYTEDPTYGRLLHIQRVRGSEEGTGSKEGTGIAKGVRG